MEFYKYQGAGNDFILIDNRAGNVSLTGEQIALMCNRNFGIGADGLMLLENTVGFDFKMVYFNSDGRESTMCGNGGRCIAAFAKKMGIIHNIADFQAIDGGHIAKIDDDGLVSLQMKDVDTMLIHEGYTMLNTGSPHFVKWVSDLVQTDVYGDGHEIRNRKEFQPDGINVNFVESYNGKLLVRTYERGVENETMSCGTGVTAAAIAASCTSVGEFETEVETPGGILKVAFTKDGPMSAKQITLTGPAEFVFQGQYIAR